MHDQDAKEAQGEVTPDGGEKGTCAVVRFLVGLDFSCVKITAPSAEGLGSAHGHTEDVFSWHGGPRQAVQAGPRAEAGAEGRPRTLPTRGEASRLSLLSAPGTTHLGAPAGETGCCRFHAQTSPADEQGRGGAQVQRPFSDWVRPVSSQQGRRGLPESAERGLPVGGAGLKKLP